MPILPKCAECKRIGGYAHKTTDKICARCYNKKKAKKKK